MISALASVSFLPSSEGGLTAPLTTPCRSLLLRVDANGSDEVHIGVSISGEQVGSIEPGKQYKSLRFDFWADVAEIYIRPGINFVLTYPTRPVATGRVTEWSAE